MAKVFNRCIINCNLCNTQFTTKIKGIALGKTIIANCGNDECPNYHLSQNFKISYWYPNNLGAVYLSLISDMGYQGVKALSYITNVRHSHKESYTKMSKFIYKLMQIYYTSPRPTVLPLSMVWSRPAGPDRPPASLWYDPPQH